MIARFRACVLESCLLRLDADQLLFPVHYVELVEHIIRARQGDIGQIYRALGRSAEELQQPETHLTEAQFKALVSLALDNLPVGREPRFIQALHHLPMTAHGLVGMVAMTADTLGEALDSALHYLPLLLPAFELSRVMVGNEAHVYIKRLCDFGSPANEWLTELVVGSIGQMAQFASGARLGIENAVRFSMRVNFSHACSENAEAYDAHFGAPVRFNRGEDFFMVSRSVMNQPLLTSNRVTRMTLESMLDRQLQALPQHAMMSRRVQRILKQSLTRGGMPSAVEVAGDLAMSVRTLSRRLSEEGTSFLAIAEEVRIERAELLLISSAMPLAKMAVQLGFSDSTAFSRAFKRVKGCAPSELRKHAAGMP